MLAYFFGTLATLMLIARIMDMFVTASHQTRIIRQLETLWFRIEVLEFPEIHKRVSATLHGLLASAGGRGLSKKSILWSGLASSILTFFSLTTGWYLRGVYPSYPSAIKHNLAEWDVPLSILANLPFDLATIFISSRCFLQISRSRRTRAFLFVAIDLIAASALAIGCVYTCDFLVRNLLDATTYGVPVTPFSVLSGFSMTYLALTDPLNCEANVSGLLTTLYAATMFIPTFIALALILLLSIAKSVLVSFQFMASHVVQSATEQRGSGFKVFQLSTGTLMAILGISMLATQGLEQIKLFQQTEPTPEKVNELFNCLEKRNAPARSKMPWRFLALSTPDGVRTRVAENVDSRISIRLKEIKAISPNKVNISADVFINESARNAPASLNVLVDRFPQSLPKIGRIGTEGHCFNAFASFDSMTVFGIEIAIDSPGEGVCQLLERPGLR